MKRLFILLFFLPVLFACSKEELFEEGQEIVLNMSVDMGDLQSATTRTMGDNVEGTPALWLVVFDSEGYLVEWTKAYDLTPSTNGPTTFKARLHATLEGRIMHFLLNYVDDAADLQFDYGHENNIIGGLTVERDRDVYWQRVELPEGITGNATVEKYLTKVPLVRNFSKIKVTEACDHFELLGFYVLNVPKRGTVAPFINGSFVKYYNENAQFNGADFTPKTYATLNTEGYTGTMPDDDERINKHTEFTESMQLLGPNDSYYLYESTYINGNKDKTVSVLLKGNYNGTIYWYRVDLVKPDAQTGVIEYFDVLRNFAYTINITHVTAGKTLAKDAIEQPAGNNILSSLDIAHLTNVSDGTATLEVNYTDTVLISNDAVTVRYKFTDTGSGANDNSDIANKQNECGWYLTYDGQTPPVEVAIAGSNSDGWCDVTISVNDATITERKEVSITFFATSTTKQVLSRTVHYTLMPKQTMLVECPILVPERVGEQVDVAILIPDGLPEAMFPLDFAIEAQAACNSSYLAQYITPVNSEEVSVQTGGSIVDVPNLNGKKSFQYVVSLSFVEYKQLATVSRTINGQNLSMRILSTDFKTNTAKSASTVYAYNRYFTLGRDNFANGENGDFVVSFSDDNTGVYGVGRSIKLDIIASEAGDYKIESTTLQAPTRAISTTVKMAAGEMKTIDLVTSSFADRGQVTVICVLNAEQKSIMASERNTLNAKVASAKYNDSDLANTIELGVYKTANDASSEANRVASTIVNKLTSTNGAACAVAGLAETDVLYFSYVEENYIYTASATVANLNNGTAQLNFTRSQIVANITNLVLSGDKYYGEGQTVTLTFNTNRAGTYTITQTEGSTTKTYTHTATSAGTQTVTLTTQTWSDKLNVTVSGMNASAVSVEGATRNTIKFGQLTLNASDNSSTSNRSVTIKINGTQVATNVSSGNLSGYEFTRANVNSSDNVELSYQRSSGGTYVSSQLIENLINDISVTFTKQ